MEKGRARMMCVAIGPGQVDGFDFVHDASVHNSDEILRGWGLANHVD